MKVTKEKTGTCEYTLNVEVEPERVQGPMHQAAQRLNKRRPLAGFRPGKAPYALIERMYGKSLIVDEMLDTIGNDLYQEAIKDSELEPYAAAHLDIVQPDPLQLKFIVPVLPVVTLGDYHKIHVKQKAARVKKADIEEVLTRLREANAMWVPVERAVQMGDQVQFDAIGTKEDGSQTDQKDLSIELREEMSPVEFAQGLLGMQAGQNKEFDVTYPEDFGDKDLAGKHMHFAVTAKSVKAKELPELNDEFAKAAGNYENLAQLRAKIETELHAQKEAESKDAVLTTALDKLVDQATMEYPNIAVDHEIESIIESFANRLRQQGFTLEGYLEMMKKTPAQFYDETRPQAEKRLKRSLSVAKFAEAEGIQVDPKEIETEIDRLSQSYGEKAAEVKALFGSGEPLRSITGDVYQRKALEHLFALVTGKTEGTSEAPEAEETAEASVETADDVKAENK